MTPVFPGASTEVTASLEVLASSSTPRAGRTADQWLALAAATRALAYHDQRQALREWLAQAEADPAAHTGGLGLAVAEAHLECGSEASAVSSWLADVDIRACAPLALEVSDLWRQWLLAEFAWWQTPGDDCASQIHQCMAALLQAPLPECDPFTRQEWQRVAQRAALLATRCALSQRLPQQAQTWLTLAEQYQPGAWDNHYFAGLLAWSSGDYAAARTHLEQSLVANPHQGRVRFELAVLRAAAGDGGSAEHPAPIPGVHDTLATTAVALFRLGRQTEAREQLTWLDKPEAPFSQRLIWPQARAARLRQGRALCAHLAEAEGDWLKALAAWDGVRGTPSMGQPPDVDHRSHRLYLLGRHLREQRASRPDQVDRTLNAQFHKELSALSLRILTGDARFYWSLAAAAEMPDRALAGWRGLVRQTAWLAATQRATPGHLLCLGDRLMRGGVREDAVRAYRAAHAVSAPGAAERAFIGELLNHPPMDGVSLVRVLEDAPDSAQAGGFWLFLRGCGLLAQAPPDCAAARPILEQAHQKGLPGSLASAGEALLALAAGGGDSCHRPPSATARTSLGSLPPALRAGLELLSWPEGVTTLRRFAAVFGAEWTDLCPIAPAEILGLQLHRLSAGDRPDFQAALREPQKGELLGAPAPPWWHTLLLAAMAVRLALDGKFEAATAAQQQAVASLSNHHP